MLDQASPKREVRCAKRAENGFGHRLFGFREAPKRESIEESLQRPDGFGGTGYLVEAKNPSGLYVEETLKIR